jgi:hypothetical protein
MRGEEEKRRKRIGPKLPLDMDSKIYRKFRIYFGEQRYPRQNKEPIATPAPQQQPLTYAS